MVCLSEQIGWFLALLLTVQIARAANTTKPNVLVILVDDLGWGDVSFHGTSQVSTPNIDLLATSGVILDNFYVSPICSPSRSALLTGYNPIHTGMQHHVIAVMTPYGLPLKYKTAGDHFREIGYSTHIVGKWHQGHHMHQYLPTSRGFDTFLGYLTSRSDYYNRMGGDLRHGYDFWENDQHANLSAYEGQYSTDLYTDRVIKLIEQHSSGGADSSKPFFIYFAQQSIHGGAFQQLPKRNIQPPTRFENDFQHIKNDQRRRFAGMIAALDESVGRVFRALHKTGQLDNTIIYLSTDNGGASGNGRGGHIDDSQGSNYPLKGSKYTIWEGGVRGTGLIWSARHLTRPHVSKQLMHLTDVLPTLYAAVGGNVSALGPIDGHNLWPELLSASSVSVRQHIIHHIDHEEMPWRMWAVRQGRYKLTSGTWDHGNYDVWYRAPGQLSENGTICYHCSDVYAVLAARGQTPAAPTIVSVNCNRDHLPQTPCHAATQNEEQYCLFDIEADPCETTNLAQSNATLAKEMYAVYKKLNAGYVKPINKPQDFEADPALHNGWIGPWK